MSNDYNFVNFLVSLCCLLLFYLLKFNTVIFESNIKDRDLYFVCLFLFLFFFSPVFKLNF